MRKRGEVDRAIAIHTELTKHREAAVREQATFALGLDYMSAGVLDRAEEKLRSLLGSTQYRPAVLERLAWVYEQQRDWLAALDVWRELPAEQQRERAGVAAHYCCELGEAALAANDLGRGAHSPGRGAGACARGCAGAHAGGAYRRRVGRRGQGAAVIRRGPARFAHPSRGIRAGSA